METHTAQVAVRTLLRAEREAMGVTNGKTTGMGLSMPVTENGCLRGCFLVPGILFKFNANWVNLSGQSLKVCNQVLETLDSGNASKTIDDDKQKTPTLCPS